MPHILIASFDHGTFVWGVQNGGNLQMGGIKSPFFTFSARKSSPSSQTWCTELLWLVGPPRVAKAQVLGKRVPLCLDLWLPEGKGPFPCLGQGFSDGNFASFLLKLLGFFLGGRG